MHHSATDGDNSNLLYWVIHQVPSRQLVMADNYLIDQSYYDRIVQQQPAARQTG
jgi:uncharacterized protein (UPF0262 family)